MLKRLGKYEIVRELGQGAMGVVYEARDPMIGRRVALKTITAALAEKADLRDRFFREAQAAGNLEHENIITVYDMGVENQTPYIAMQFIEGETLEKLISEKRPLPLVQKVGYFVQVCRGLDFAHKGNVVHRDIKPANIMITRDGVIKIVDFGIARLTASSHTQTGMMIGTIAYMSPEQVQGHHVDGRSDIWSMGVTFYEFLTNQRPFSADNLAAVMFNIVSPTSKPMPLKPQLPEAPDELQWLMDRIFQKNPEDRYQSMEDVLLDIEPIYKRLQQAGISERLSVAESHLQSGEFEKARDILRQAIKTDPDNRAARELLERVNQEARRHRVGPELRERTSRAEQLLLQGKLTEADSEVAEALRLDSNFLQAIELQQKIKEARLRQKEMDELLRGAAQKRDAGDVTGAEMMVDRVIAQFGQDPRALELRRQLEEMRARRQSQRILDEKKQEARQLLASQRYHESAALLEEVLRQAPGDTEASGLLESARVGIAQAEKQTRMDSAMRLLAEQKFSESLEICETLLQLNPTDSAVQRLRNQVLQQRSEHAKRVRQQRELESLKRMLADGEFAAVVHRGEAYLQEFADDYDARQILETARARVEEAERRQKATDQTRAINTLMEQGQYEAAVAEAQKTIIMLPGMPEFDSLLAAAQTKLQQQNEEKKQRFIAQQIEAMQRALERKNPTEAIQLARQTIVAVGEDPKLTQILNIAEHEHQVKAQQRAAGEMLGTVVQQWNEGKFEQAQQGLEGLQKTHIFNQSDIESLLEQVKQHKPAPPAQTIYGHFSDFMKIAEPEAAPPPAPAEPAPPAQAAPSAPDATQVMPGAAPMTPEDEFIVSKPVVELGEVKKKKKKKKEREFALRREEDFEATVKWEEPLPAAPAEPAPPAADFSATTVAPPDAFRPSAPQAPADFSATTVAPPEALKAPPAAPAAGFSATTIAPPEALKAPPPAPSADFTATTVARPESPAAPADFSATTVEKLPPAPPKKKEKVRAEAPAFEETIKAPPKPKAEVRREAPRPAPVAEEKPKSNLGLFAGIGVAAVLIISFVVWKFVLPSGGPPAQNETPAETRPEPPRVDPWIAEQKGHYDQAQASFTSGKYDDALAAVNNGLAKEGPLTSSLNELKGTIEKAKAGGAEFEKFRKEEANLFDRAMGLFNKHQFDQAKPAFLAVVNLPKKYPASGGKGARTGDAQKYINEIIPAREKEESDFAQARRLAASTDVATLRQAKQLLDQIAELQSVRADEAARLSSQVSDAVTRLEGQATAAANAAAQLRTLQGQVTSALDSGDFALARSKLGEFDSVRHDTASSEKQNALRNIERRERDKASEWDTRFNTASSGKSKADLERLNTEIAGFRGGSSPILSSKAAELSPRIDSALKALSAGTGGGGPGGGGVTPPPSCSAQATWPGTSKVKQGPVGDLESEEFIDGGPKLNNWSVPPAVASQACGKTVTLRLSVNKAGAVTAAAIFPAQTSAPASVADAVKSEAAKWQFAPPKVKDRAVSTIVLIRVDFK
jgi:serine/threonine-protein kinase